MVSRRLPPARNPDLWDTPLDDLFTKVDYDGYVSVRLKANCWEQLHRMVMAQHLGRPLLPGEEIHHKDENKANNDITNLVLTTKVGHPTLHREQREAQRKESLRQYRDLERQLRRKQR